MIICKNLERVRAINPHSFKCEGIADWLGAAVTGGTGLIGSVLGMIGANRQNHLQRDINNQNIAMQRETNKLNEDLFKQNLAFQSAERKDQNAVNWRNAVDMFDMENAYNTPAMQVQRYLNAGLNPMAAGKDAGLASGSSPASGSNVSANNPVLASPHSQLYDDQSQIFIQSASSIASALAQLSEAKYKSAKTEETESTMGAYLDYLLAERRNLDEQTLAQQIENGIKMEFAHKNATADLNNKIVEFGETFAHMKSLLAEEQFYSAESELSNVRKVGEELGNMLKGKDLSTYMQRFNQWMKQSNQDIQESKSRVSENYASAEEHRSSASVKDVQYKILDVERWFNERKKQWFDNRKHLYKKNGKLYAQDVLDEMFNADFRMKLKELSKTDKDLKLLDEQLNKVREENRLLDNENDWYTINQVFNIAWNSADRLTNLMPFFKPRKSESVFNGDVTNRKAPSETESFEGNYKYENGDWKPINGNKYHRTKTRSR